MVGDAKFEKLVRRESRQQLLLTNSGESGDKDKELPEVTDDEAELLETLEDEAANSRITLSFLIKINNGCNGIGTVLHCLEVESFYYLTPLNFGLGLGATSIEKFQLLAEIFLILFEKRALLTKTLVFCT